MCFCSLSTSWSNVVFSSDPHACIQHSFFYAFYYFEGKSESRKGVLWGSLIFLLIPVPCVIFVRTYNLSFIRPILTLTRQTLNVLVFQYFYGILQSYVAVFPPVYVNCLMKYDNENVKGNILSILFVNIHDMLYITHHLLCAFIVRNMTVYLQYIQLL